jgi:tetratricopeptide (TPR) repeat protein
MSTTDSPPSPRQYSSSASLLDRAKQGDTEAIGLMFRQFIGPEEHLLAAEYLGTRGIFGLGTHSFGCVTDRRVADIELGLFGRLVYQDAYLEHVNSSAFYQPSLLLLYLSIFGIGAAGVLGAFASGLGVLVAALILALTALLIVFAARIYFHFVKSGVLFWVREGIPVYIFANRKRLPQAARVWRLCAQARDERVTGTSRSVPLPESGPGATSLGRRRIPDVAIAVAIVGVLAIGGLAFWSSVQESLVANPESSTVASEPALVDTAMLATTVYEAAQHSQRGNQLAAESNWADAEAEFRRAVELEPGNAMYQNQWGVALTWLDRMEEAEVAFQEAVRLDPSNEQYRANLESAGGS